MADATLERIEQMKRQHDIDGLRKLADWGDLQALQALEAVQENDNNTHIHIHTLLESGSINDVQELAASGDGCACCCLSEYYSHQNPEQSFEWAKKSANAGSPRGQYRLAALYANGFCTTQDSQEAVKWLERVAEQGDRSAQCWLAKVHCNRDFLIKGMPNNPVGASKYFRKAADQGDRDSQYALGVCYYDGYGVPMDLSEAVKWWRKAAERGDSPAAYNLGFCYHQGRGVQKDGQEAIAWFRKAVEYQQDDRNRYRHNDVIEAMAQKALRILQRPGFLDLFRGIEGPYCSLW